jgi:hypothetical protein
MVLLKGNCEPSGCTTLTCSEAEPLQPGAQNWFWTFYLCYII